LRSEYNIKAISLHDGHALVTESIVKVRLISGMELINAQLVHRSLGVRADADDKPE
jgi:hypothetical protein